MAPAYTVAAHFHLCADAIDVMKQVIDEVTRTESQRERLPDFPLVTRRRGSGSVPALHGVARQSLLRRTCCLVARTEGRTKIGERETAY